MADVWLKRPGLPPPGHYDEAGGQAGGQAQAQADKAVAATEGDAALEAQMDEAKGREAGVEAGVLHPRGRMKTFALPPQDICRRERPGSGRRGVDRNILGINLPDTAIS